MKIPISGILILLVSISCSNSGKKAGEEPGMTTSDTLAYSYYQQGINYQNQSSTEADTRSAIQMFQLSVERDPGYALAWAGLAKSSRELYWFGFDKSEENLTRTKEYLDKALSLAPDSKDVRFEEAYYYYHCKLDYNMSLQLLKELETDYPDDDKISFLTAMLYRRMGDPLTSLEYNNKAISLNPTRWSYISNIYFTYQSLRNFTDAERSLLQAMELSPSNSGLYANLYTLYMDMGQIQKAVELLETQEESFDPQQLKRFQTQMALFSGNYDDALQIAGSFSEDPIYGQNFYHTKHFELGMIYRAMPDPAMAAKEFEMEKDAMLEKVQEYPNDHRIHRSLGISYAALGMREQALEAGNKALEIQNFNIDHHGSLQTELDMVRIMVLLGDFDGALNRLDEIMKEHGGLTTERLKIDPFWGPVRNEEKFQEILNNPDYQII